MDLVLWACSCAAIYIWQHIWGFHGDTEHQSHLKTSTTPPRDLRRWSREKQASWVFLVNALQLVAALEGSRGGSFSGTEQATQPFGPLTMQLSPHCSSIIILRISLKVDAKVLWIDVSKFEIYGYMCMYVWSTSGQRYKLSICKTHWRLCCGGIILIPIPLNMITVKIKINQLKCKKKKTVQTTTVMWNNVTERGRQFFWTQFRFNVHEKQLFPIMRGKGGVAGCATNTVISTTEKLTS